MFFSRLNNKNQSQNNKSKKSVFQKENPQKEAQTYFLAYKLASKLTKPIQTQQTQIIDTNEIPELQLKEQISSPLKFIAMGLKLIKAGQETNEVKVNEEDEIFINKAKSQITEKIVESDVTEILIEK